MAMVDFVKTKENLALTEETLKDAVFLATFDGKDAIKQLLNEHAHLVSASMLEIVIGSCYYNDEGLINGIFDEYPNLISHEILEKVVSRGLTFQYQNIVERIFEEYPDQITSRMFKNAVAKDCQQWQFEKAQTLFKKYPQLVDQDICRVVMIWAGQHFGKRCVAPPDVLNNWFITKVETNC